MHTTIFIRLGWVIDVFLSSLNCMQMQAVVHQMHAVSKSCSVAIAVEH